MGSKLTFNENYFEIILFVIIIVFYLGKMNAVEWMQFNFGTVIIYFFNNSIQI